MGWFKKLANKATGGTWDPYVTSDELELYGNENNTFGQNLTVAKQAKRKSIRDARKSDEPNWFDRFEEDVNAKKARKIWSDPQRRADWSPGGKYSRESSAPRWQRYFREFDEAAGLERKNEGGGINIDPKNKGKFTAKAKSKGKSVQGYASQVLANKESYSPATVKQANFARNAAKWSKNEGGMIDLDDPTNRDTVPAMLTPGEFVLNKEATALFGPQIEAMNQAGLAQRKAGNEMVQANIGKKISKLHGEGYTAPGQAFAIAKSMGCLLYTSPSPRD